MPTYQDKSLAHGFFFRRRTSAARGGCSFRMGWAQLRKLLKKASTPRSSPPLGPDAPNAPECSRVAYPCRKDQVRLGIPSALLPGLVHLEEASVQVMQFGKLFLRPTMATTILDLIEELRPSRTTNTVWDCVNLWVEWLLTWVTALTKDPLLICQVVQAGFAGARNSAT